MLSNPLIAFANAYNFKISEDYAYGEIDSFLVSVSNDGYKKMAFVNFFTPESEEGDGMVKFKLSDSIKALSADYPALSDYEVFINGVVIKTGADLSDFDSAISALCGLIKEMGLLGMPVCSECGYTVDNTPAYFSIINNRAAFTCDECTAAIKSETEAVASKEKKGSKKRGVVFSCLGAFLAFLIFVTLFSFVIPYNGIKFGSEDSDRINALIFAIPLSAFVSFLTFLFYRLFTRRKGAERILPCFIVSAVFSVASVYCSTAVMYTNSFGLGFSAAAKMFSTIICAPVTDPYYRNSFVCYGLYSLAAVIAVTLIYSLIYDNKKPSEPMFVLIDSDDAGSDISEETDENDVEVDASYNTIATIESTEKPEE